MAARLLVGALLLLAAAGSPWPGGPGVGGPWTGAAAHADEPAPAPPLRAVDAAGAPLPEARLAWARALDTGRRVLDLQQQPLARADEAGRLALPGAAPEGAAAVLWAPGRLPRLLAPDARGDQRLEAASAVRGALRWSGGRAAARVPLLLEPLGSADALAVRVRTDGEGRYAVDLLPAGPWRLLLERADGQRQVLRSVGLGEEAGEALVARPGGVQGRLVDVRASGSVGAAGVALRLLPLPRRAESAPSPALQAQTDADGRFLLLDVPPGVYDLVLLDGDWMFDDPVARVEAPGEGIVREASWFVARRVALAGRVETADKRPVAGARVRLLRDPRDPVTAAHPEEPPAEAVTDAEGRYLLARLRPLSGLRVLIAAAGYAPFLSEPFELLTVGETRLKPAVLTTGFDLDVEVRGEGEKPVAGAEVVAASAEHPGAATDPALAPFVARGRTDADGRVSLRGLADTAYALSVRAPGRLPHSETVDPPRGGSSARRRVLLAAAPAITGRVLRGDGRPAAGRTLRAWPRDAAAREPRSVVTGADGAFALRDLAPVPHDLEVLGEGGAPLHRLPGVQPDEPPLDVVLPLPGAITGRLRGLRPGRAASVLLEAEVSVAEDDRPRRRVVAVRALPPEGPAEVYRFDDLSPGAYVVRLAQGALSTDGLPVQVDAERTAEADLELPEPGSVAGQVLDGLGRPAFGVRVRLTRLQADGDAHLPPGGPLLAVTGDRGGYVFSDVGPGLWRVDCEEPGQGADVEVLRLVDGETVLVRDLSLLGSARLTGRVRRGDGRPVDGARLLLRLLEGDAPVWRTLTAGDGGYRVDGLWPGTYEVRVDEGPGAEVVRSAVVALEAGEVGELDFTPVGEGVIEGLVLRRGARVAGARLRAELEPPEGSALARTLYVATDASGAFTLRQLEAGTYRLLLEDGTALTGGEVTLGDGDRREVDLELWEGRLPGLVLAADGRAVVGARVHAVPSQAVAGTLSAEAVTDAEGRFVLTGLPPGRYDLTIRGRDLPTAVLRGALADAPGADRPVTVVLGVGSRLDVEVRGRDGRAVAGARVRVQVEGDVTATEVLATTGPSGRVRLLGIPPGRVRVDAYARDLGRARTVLDLVEGTGDSVTLRLEAPGTLLVGLEGLAAEQVARARVDLLQGDEVVVRRRALPQRWTGVFFPVLRAGTLRLSDLAPGEYEVRLEAGSRWSSATARVVVRSGEITSVRLEPERRGR